MTESPINWKKLAEEKKKSVDDTIPKEWLLPTELLSKYDETTPVSVLDIPSKFLNESELNITENYNVKELLEQLKIGNLLSIDVIKAFSHRAAIATQLTNCCTELMFESAFERAKFLDDYLIKNGKTIGPLHGLPISLKDSFHIPGFDSTIGYISLINNKDKIFEMSSYAKLLFDLGAIFYVKTNIPQTLMTGDSENNIFGRTLNPNNLTWTAGGSSGGEGALIKMRGSLIGIGTDVAGSIRIPSLCNGVYGFRPTSCRLPTSNQEEPSREVFVDILAVAGPLSIDFETLKLITKETINQKPWNYDPGCLRINYQNSNINKDSTKLKIGILIEDPELPVHPPIKRIINEASKLLINSGHSIEFIKNFPSIDKSWGVAWELFKLDSNSTSFAKLFETNERIIESLKLPGLDAYGQNGPKNIDELIKLKLKVKKLTNDWLKIFENFDVIISPGSPSTAPPHDDYGIAPYTCIWNVVDFPAVIIPFGKANSNIDIDDDSVIYPKKLNNIYAHYNALKYDGGLGAIQVVAPHLEDEKLLDCCEIIDKVLNL
ncbi:hypothetical protein C6P40_002626 [Pichia californica]|uniref:Amidase domain-containing protein n=1 Tax=Pichia californica TaxID=460514 RepID=A0A9P7BFE8_9ASCO|nr:hypothetical protein C6P42_002571 [[Candida] californica]KAG0687243.1 hypothetical protein C6P40_002626 [[Candida] californica]